MKPKVEHTRKGDCICGKDHDAPITSVATFMLSGVGTLRSHPKGERLSSHNPELENAIDEIKDKMNNILTEADFDDVEMRTISVENIEGRPEAGNFYYFMACITFNPKRPPDYPTLQLAIDGATRDIIAEHFDDFTLSLRPMTLPEQSLFMDDMTRDKIDKLSEVKDLLGMLKMLKGGAPVRADA